MTRIGLIDYGAGNFMSVFNALEYLNIPFFKVRNAAIFDKVSHLVLPGVGTFQGAMRKLEILNLVNGLKEQIFVKKKPFLGICVGLQILASLGKEFGESPGLGIIEGTVERIDADEYGLKLPHMGWNELRIYKSCRLLGNMNELPEFYFLHSFHLLPIDRGLIVATCQYGGEVTAVIEKENIYGVQFHPEKSQRNGLQLLRNFCSIKG
jgi:glutamine amidotransferase